MIEYKTEDIKIGDMVILTSTQEIGMVVHQWKNKFTDLTENYVCFFGKEIPKGRPQRKPQVLKYESHYLKKFNICTDMII